MPFFALLPHSSTVVQRIGINMNGLLMEWIFIKLFPTAGRIGRKEYILGVVSDYMILFLLFTLALFGESLEKYNISLGAIVKGLGMYSFLVFFAVAYIRSICWTIRRLHDLDRPGVHYFLTFFPIYNFYLLILLIFKQGTFGANSYGSDPIIMIV